MNSCKSLKYLRQSLNLFTLSSSKITKRGRIANSKQPDEQTMKTKVFFATVTATFLTIGAYAQTTPAPEKNSTKPGHDHHSEAHNARKEKLKAMSPDERKAFLETRKKQREERLASMTPKEREMAKSRLEMREKFKKMTPQEKEAFRQKMKAQWEAMTPEQREAFKQGRRKEREDKFSAMTPEQREQAKARMEERRAKHTHRND